MKRCAAVFGAVCLAASQGAFATGSVPPDFDASTAKTISVPSSFNPPTNRTVTAPPDFNPSNSVTVQSSPVPSTPSDYNPSTATDNYGTRNDLKAQSTYLSADEQVDLIKRNEADIRAKKAAREKAQSLAVQSALNNMASKQ